MIVYYYSLLFLVFPSVITIEVLNLNGDDWILNSADNQHINIPVSVPGGVYTDLMKNNIIGNVFEAYNDVNTRWVSKINWTYTKHFDGTAQLLEYNNIILKLDGIDTFATVSVNGIMVGNTDNMFVQFNFDIKQHLKVGDNILEIDFESPVNKATNAYLEQLENYLVPPKCVPAEYRGECHVNHIRKMQASFSWDWGPAFPSMGVWNDVTITAFNNTVIKYIQPTIKSVDDKWKVYVTTQFEKNSIGEIDGMVLVKLFTDVNSVEVVSNWVLPNKRGEYINTQTISIPKSNVKLWWPNGYGEQHLYTLKVTFSDGIKDVSKRVKIGFRTLELHQDEVENGNLFYFVVNSIPIFAKGTNSIPIHLLPEQGHSDPEHVRHLLTSAAAVHMNMIRVWGGGMYELDRFYELCDELGIMVWQDFMFACSMYPVNEEFLENVRNEVRHQISRLQHHPSIIMWAGNNENEAALRQNWYGTSIDFERYKADFIQLYVDTIKPIVLEMDPSRPFMTSSPTNGVQSEKEGHVAMQPASNFYGDVHFYNYIFDSWDSNVYPITRFASEYGYQAFPSINTMLKVANMSDLVIGGTFIDHIQHHPLGNLEMPLLMRHRLPLPSSSAVTKEQYTRAYLFYSQIAQAQAIRIETEHYRRWRSDFDENGQGRCMGALYWQLNDVWVGPTWAGIDLYGNWKMLHYFAKDFFAPLIISPNLNSNRNVDIFVVSDQITNSIGLTATLTIYKWNDFNPIRTENLPMFDITGGSAKRLTTFWLDEYLEKSNCGTMSEAKLNCFVKLMVSDETGKEVTPVNYIMPSALKDTILTRAQVTISAVAAINDTTFTVTVNTDNVACYVWLESATVPGIFSENGFWMLSATKTVTYTARSAADIVEFKKSLTVTHLMDSQYFR